MDNCGPATVLYKQDLINNNKIQRAMKAKWGDEFTYKIIQVFVVTKLDDVEPGTYGLRIPFVAN